MQILPHGQSQAQRFADWKWETAMHTLTHPQSVTHSFIRSVKYLLGVDIAVEAPNAAKLFSVFFPFSQSELTMATIQHQIVDKLIHRQMKIDTKKNSFECELRQSW